MPDTGSTTKAAPRILEVLYSFRVGGSELLGLELARQLKQTGCEVMCTALDGMSGPLIDRCTEYGLKVVDLGLPLRNALGRNGISWTLVKRLRELQLDSIHLQHFLGLNKLGLPARLAGVPRITVTEHSVLDASQSLAGRFRIRLNWRIANNITVIHPDIKTYLVNTLGVDDSRVQVIPVGVELDRWHRNDRDERRAALDVSAETVFVFVGRVAPVKNIPALIRVFLDTCSKTSAPLKLLIVGDGPDMPECKAIAGAHPLGASVAFAGEQQDTRPYVAASDIFIMNSLSEGTPRAMLEAMAMGLPGIGPAVGGLPTLLNDRGWITEPRNDSSLASAIVDAATDRSKAQTFGNRAAQYVAGHFDAAKVLADYRELLFER